MNKLRILSVALTTLVLASGCATGFKATHDHDPSADFSDYKSFAWVSEHPMTVGSTDRIPNPMLEGRIMTAVEVALGEKGFTLVPDIDAADFALAFTVGSREEIKVDSYPSMTAGYAGYGYPRHWGAWGSPYYGYGMETNVRQYTKGMLAIDVFDVSEHRPVWHGVATKTINESDRKEADKTIRDAVAAILAGFPPTP